MWADNEADVDLLGFEYLVDELLTALTTGALLPLTVGVLGEWGSGKSSLLKIAQQELDSMTDPEFLTVSFSPWQHEDFDDVKLSLMSAVLSACEARGADQARIKGLKKFVSAMGMIGRRAGRVALKTVPTIAGGVASALDPTSFDPMTTAVVAKAVGSASEVFLEEVSADDNPALAVTTLGDFRVKFADMIKDLNVQAVVVFIDDLDRCLPNTVVDTFEAIRLFLNTPKTAFVIGTHRQIAEAAIDAAFPEYGRLSGPGLGHDYLEKMLQVQITVPALSVEDSATYVGLLHSRLHLDDDAFKALCDAVAVRRRDSPFSRAFDVSFAATHLADKLSPDLKTDLDWAEEIIPAVAGALRGNPRQTKRFLNDIRLRQHAASRRGVVLEPAILAKLMVLEEIDFEALQTLFDWQVASEGPIPELNKAEQPATTEPVAKSAKKETTGIAGTAAAASDDALDLLSIWKSRPSVTKWLGLSPALGAVDLRPYFNYFRSSLVFNSRSSALPDDLKSLLQQLTSEVTAIRRKGINAFIALSPAQQDLLWEALEANIRQRPDSRSWDASAEISAKSERHGQAFIATLTVLSERLIPAHRVLSLYQRVPAGASRDALFTKWKTSDVKALSAAAGAIDRAVSR